MSVSEDLEICIFVCMYTCLSLNGSSCKPKGVYMYVNVRKNMYICVSGIYVNMYICEYVYMYTCKKVNVRKCGYVYFSKCIL